MNQPVLTGRRVLELGVYVAAPFAGRMLADLGAEVIKIEAPAGDPTRTSAFGFFVAYNVGKRSLCLDLSSPEGYSLFEKLLKTADVLIHNLAPKAAQRLKVTYEDCYSINPDAIYCHIKGYGSGPLQNERASNPIIEAATGVMDANRVDGRPTRLGPSYHDMFAGTYAVVGILAALTAHNAAKECRRVEVALYETGLHLAGGDLVANQVNAQTNSGKGGVTRSAFDVPGYGAYQTSDHRWIYLVLLTDEHWRKFSRAMLAGRESDPSLDSVQLRREHRELVENLVTNSVSALSFDEVAARLQQIGVGYTEVKPKGKVLDEPQAMQRGKVLKTHFLGREYKVPQLSIVSGSVGRALDLAPPHVGEHSVEIAQSLGYDASECAALVERGVIKTS
jgi:crotonobetainyl-CoA:carnitine CoA-transferase CaiB-like acyl-CoA transferase